MAEKKVNYTCKCTTKENNLNIRANPNTTSNIVNKIKKGTTNIKVTKVDGIWYYIPASKGWGHSNYLSIITKNESTSNGTKEVTNKIKDIIKTSTSNNILNKSIVSTFANKQSIDTTEDNPDLNIEPTYKSKKTGLEGDAKLSKLLEKRIVEVKRTIRNNGLIYSPAYGAQWHNKFKRIELLDPYNTLVGNTKEYLFFVKPDLNLISVGDKTKGNLMKPFSTDPFFMDLATNSPDVIYDLQYSAKRKPFVSYLSGMIKSTLQIQNIEAETVETATNIYGTMIEYRGDGHKSNENIQFSLEFADNKELETYQFFKAYEKYEECKKKGIIGPKYNEYRTSKILHDTMGIYKFIVDEDLETIVYYAYYCGVIPLTVPRDAFSEIEAGKIISYNIDFKSAFVEDMEPIILRDFNILSEMQLGNNIKEIPVYSNTTDMFNGEWARGAKVVVVKLANGRHVYKLKWYK